MISSVETRNPLFTFRIGSGATVVGPNKLV